VRCPAANRERRRIRPVTTSVNPSAGPDFGPNEWLVHEIWQQYQQDPESVSPEWRDFLSDYRPVDGTGGTTPSGRRQEDEQDSEGGSADAPNSGKAASSAPSDACTRVMTGGS